MSDDIKRNTEFVESDIHVIDQLGLPVAMILTRHALRKKRADKNNDGIQAKKCSLYYHNLIILVHSRCLRLLCSITSFTPQRLWSLVRAANGLSCFSNTIRCLDYLELDGLYQYYDQKRKHRRPFAYHVLYKYRTDASRERVKRLFVMMDSDVPDEKDLWDYWMGDGAMFCFKRHNL